MTLSRAPGSFRDPHGSVLLDGDRVFRSVRGSYAETWSRLHESGFLEAAWDQGLLVHHELADPRELGDLAGAEALHCVIQPDRIPFLSHPYEWCFGQLKEAALLTLRLQRLALDHGLSLKDATAFNVQFVGSHPVFIDTLSFEPHVDGRPWAPYRQFCEHFLAPLALAATRGPELLVLLRSHLDGIPLELASRLLPWTSRLRLGTFLHVHLHARAQRRHAASRQGAERASQATLDTRALTNLIEALQGTVAGLSWEPSGTVWADYEETCDYSRAAASAKEVAVQGFLDAVAPHALIDLGGNTGRLARLASDRGIPAVAVDGDPAAVELGFRAARERDDRKLLSLCMDLSNPSPDLGWRQQEREGFSARGRADALLALALIHHLIIGAGLPPTEVAAWLAESGARAVLLEWVPPEDAQASRLLATRDDARQHYRRDLLEAALAPHFEQASVTALPESGRLLLDLRRRRDSARASDEERRPAS